MPNYVRNVLVVIGKKTDVARAISSLEGENGLVDFGNIIPVPKDSNIDLHDWKIANWGSTDAVDCIKNRDNTISFSTSWTAPLKAIAVLVKKFPELDFRYYWANEDTGADSGMQLWTDGELLEEIRPYSLVYHYCWDSLAQTA